MMTKMKTPREFAERYMDRKTYLPFMTNMSGLLYLPDVPAISELEKIYEGSQKIGMPNLNKTKLLHYLERDSINADTKERIYRALYELTQAIILDIEHLKKLNKDFVKKRKDAIRHLKRILSDPLVEKRQVITAELERLEAFDKHTEPCKEIDFISSSCHVFYSGLLKKLVLKIEAHKLSDMLSTPMSFKTDRLLQFFSSVLQIAVFRYLHEHADIPKEDAEHLTMEIINEYIEGSGNFFLKKKLPDPCEQ